MAVLSSRLPTLQTQLDATQSLLSAVETRMLSVLRTSTAPHAAVTAAAQQAAAYHLGSGGQRIRARIASHACTALKLSSGDTVSIAAAAELVHNASLIHDDLQDRDISRHGNDSVWVAFGDGIAICAGDVLLSAAYCALAGISRTHLLPTLISLLHGRVSDASVGQCVDLKKEQLQTITLEAYEHLATLKAGALLSLPIELALAAAGQLQALPAARKAANSFAIGYQIFDDLNDIQKDASRLDVHPAINAVAVIRAMNVDDNPTAHARKLALMHLANAAEWSLLLPNKSGLLLQVLALDLRAQIESRLA
ncbi:MAG: hypothetical protein B7X59_06160 [Polaromonas sp. 39-63-203]|jgi:geranylgeranyl pyrophosphate synthase|nr:MAG: hypothetical protein B7Y54_06670 [Polaromonas sp. 35-63-240]OYY97628.1 MAG: hypothetical protein B7Y42_07995 [Polaromonas sp. 28-63-22]OYZ83809.1 MAG: hypothetical protein B7Y03_07170 [Polaromonas sp. 24-62-144]OZA98434.1 MAG: hypothetical protein B7X59_06160 [Polaromonas sp. 39-63-203]